jgi:hypothetical protein
MGAGKAGGRTRRQVLRFARSNDVDLLTSEETGFREDGSNDPLTRFADAGYITNVINRVKRGKEATVLCCRARPSTGREPVAAKVYTIGIGAHYRMSKIYAGGCASPFLEKRGLGTVWEVLALRDAADVDRVAEERGLCCTVDGVHLNSRGARAVADAFAERIRPAAEAAP